MKIGLITDIHNNLVALNRVLDEFEKMECEAIICSGDIIGIGPFPEETVQRMIGLKNLIVAVQGNHEHYLTKSMKDSSMSDEERKYHLWEHSKLSSQSRNYLSSLKDYVYLEIKGYKIYVSHYALSDIGYKDFKYNPNINDLEDLYENIDSDIIIFGHDHNQVFVKSNKVYINPGSLGCPGKNKNIARAGILELSNEITYQNLLIEYNVIEALDKIEECNYPAKEEIKKFFFGL